MIVQLFLCVLFRSAAAGSGFVVDRPDRVPCMGIHPAVCASPAELVDGRAIVYFASGRMFDDVLPAFDTTPDAILWLSDNRLTKLRVWGFPEAIGPAMTRPELLVLLRRGIWFQLESGVYIAAGSTPIIATVAKGAVTSVSFPTERCPFGFAELCAVPSWYPDLAGAEIFAVVPATSTVHFVNDYGRKIVTGDSGIWAMAACGLEIVSQELRDQGLLDL